MEIDIKEELRKNQAYAERNKKEFLENEVYNGSYIAILNQKVVGSDEDEGALIKKVFDEYSEEYRPNKNSPAEIPIWLVHVIE